LLANGSDPSDAKKAQKAAVQALAVNSLRLLLANGLWGGSPTGKKTIQVRSLLDLKKIFSRG
jgi:hypothetical protein